MAIKNRDKLAGIFALFDYVQNRGEVPLNELATEFDMTAEEMRELLERISTIDSPHLELADLPVVDFDLLEDGVVAFHSLPDLAVFNFTVEEAQALLISLNLLEVSLSGRELEAAQTLKTKLRNHYDLPDWGNSFQVVTSQNSAKPTVTLALRDNQWVSFTYCNSQGEVSQRLVKPLSLSMKSGHELLTGWCFAAKTERTFRLERMRETQVVPAPVGENEMSVVEDSKKRYPKVKVTFSQLPEPLAEAAVEVRQTPHGVEASFRLLDRKWLETQLLVYADLVKEVSLVELALNVQQRSREAIQLYDLFKQKP